MKSPDEVLPQLAAMFYYDSPEKEKGVSFEDLDVEAKKPFNKQAASVLICLDKLNLCITAKSTKSEAEVEALLRDRIEGTVKDFLSKITVWKKGCIAPEEFVARVMQVWKTL